MSAVPIATKVSEFVRWAMFLCGQDFDTADTYLAMVGTQQPENAHALERYVLKQTWSPTEVYFIVIDAGTKYTSRELPSWATPECIFDMNVKAQHGAALAGLKRLTHEILQRADLPAALRADLSGKWEDIQGADGDAGSDRLVQLLLPIVHGPLIKSSSGVSEQFLTAMQSAASNAFHQFRVTGNLARRVIAYTSFVLLHPSADQVYAGNFISIAPGPGQAEKVVLPILGLKHYFESPDPGARSSFIVARGAARLARRAAKDYVSQAIRKHVLGDFFRLLYAALLYYRAAMTLCDEMIAFAKNHPDVWRDAADESEVQKAWVECEEARVAILLSIQISIMKIPGHPCILDPSEFLAWVDAMAVAMGPDAAVDHVSESVITLQFPEFLRDLGLAHLVLIRGAQRDPVRLAKALAGHVDALGAAESSVMAAGEPVYQVPLLRVLLDMLRRSGDTLELERRQAQYDALMQRLAGPAPSQRGEALP